MKILFVNDYRQQVGGTEIYVDSLIQNFKSNGHLVSYYTGSDDFHKSYTERKTPFGYVRRIFNLSHLLAFKKQIEEFKPDVIHLHNIFNEVTPSILLATKDIPVVMTIHDYQIVQAVFDPELRNGKKCAKEVCPGCLNCVGLKGSIYERLKRFLHRILLKRVDLLIAPSKWSETVILKSGEKFNITQIYNGFKLEKPQPFINNKTAIYTGRLTRDKGVEYLIQATPIVLKKIPDFQTHIIGEGELSEELKKLVNTLQIQNAVSFLGKLDRSKAIIEYKKCSIFIVPSIWPENLPTVCIEALSLGKPVIATRNGGIPEIIHDGVNGLLCKSKDPHSLANSVITLLEDNTTLKNFSLNAPESIKMFSLQSHLKSLLDTYQRIITVKQLTN